jgi:beta-lactam-binding protein with PASTA domain
MRVCPSCEKPTPDHADFCVWCHEYVAWDDVPTVEAAGNGNGAQTTAATATMPPVVSTVAPPTPRPVLTLRAPGDDPQSPAPIDLRVEPGGQATVVATIRNETDVVSHFTIEVRGFEDWWTAERTVVRLLPVSELRDFEQDVPIVLHPPRSPRATAGAWTFTVAVRSVSGGDDEPHVSVADEQQGRITIAPFEALAVDARPRKVSGRRGARLALVVTNAGNETAGVGALALDHEDRCVLAPPPRPADVPPLARADLPIGVRPREPHWFGWSIDHILQLMPQVAGEARPTSAVTATYRQKPWIPWWTPLVVLLLVLVALLVWLLLPDDTTVPDVRNAPSAFAAQKELEEEELTMAPELRRAVRPELPAGTVVDQAPAPGEEVDKGKAVSLVIAVGRRRVRVPKLKGLVPAKADERLQAADLTLGNVLPKLDPKRPVAVQIPAAGTRRRRGTAVNVILAGARLEVPRVVGLTPGQAEKRLAATGLKLGPVPPDTPAGARVTGQVPAAGSRRPAGSVVTVVLAKQAKAAVAGGGGGGEGGVPAVPPGTGAAAAGAAVRQAGLVPRYVLKIAPADFGEVLATIPESGEDPPPDGKVTVVVSAGFPLIAFDNGSDVLVAGGSTGSPVRAIAEGGAIEEEPAWTPDGRRVIYRSGDRLSIASAGERPAPRRLGVDDGGRTLLHPSVAPARDRVVIAFVSRGADNRDRLCFARVFGTRAFGESCRAVPGLAIAELVWPAGGNTLLAVAKTGEHAPYGIARFTSQRPFSTDAGDWRGGGGLATPANREVIAAAPSPDGRRLAVATAVAGGGYRVALVAAADLAFEDAETLPLQGCDVGWRSDARELVVVQSDSRCTVALGRVVRVRPQEPRRLATVLMSGKAPGFQPLLTGPVTPEQLSAQGRRR